MSEAYRRVADAMGQVPQKKEPTKFQKIVDYLINDSIPAQGVKAAYGGFTLPRDVYQGKVDPLSNEAIDRSADLAGMVTLGAGAVPAQKDTLRMGIKAYHGSPHDFDKFSMGKIGTGEGAQAYGHGLYFADSEDVARSYRNKLAGDMANAGPGSQMGKELLSQAGGDRPKAMAMLSREFESDIPGYNPMSDPNYRSAMEFLESAPDGRMYEVNINANPDDFLDWDKPLSEQPQRVQDWFDSRGVTPGFAGKQSGNELFQMERTALGDEGLAQNMRESGIAGVKYLDHGSRFNAADGLGTKTNTRNYVVFNENLIEIVKKYGVAGALTAGLLTQEQAKQFTQPAGPSQGEWEAAYKAGTGA